MSTKITGVTGLALSAVFATMAFAGEANAQEYSIQDLGTLGGFLSAGNGINNLGHVAGVSRKGSSSTLSGFYWDGTTMTALPTLGRDTEAVAINGSDVVVGWSKVNFSSTHAFSWVNGVMTDLGTLGGAYSQAHGINEGGLIVGTSTPAGDGTTHAVMWNHNGAIVDLGEGSAAAINNRGIVVGDVAINGLYEPATWYHGTATILPLLPGMDSGAASGINSRGDIVGDVANTMTGEMHAVLWSNGTVIDLGTIAGDQTDAASDINESGVVVGLSGPVGTDSTHGFVWKNGTMTDLNTVIPADSGWTITGADSVNACGQITGVGYIGGRPHAYVLTPVGGSC